MIWDPRQTVKAAVGICTALILRVDRVETTGLEPATSGLQSRRSPS